MGNKNRFGEMGEPDKELIRTDYKRKLEYEGINSIRAAQIVQYLVTEANSDKTRDLIEKSDLPNTKKSIVYKILGIDVKGGTVEKTHFETTEGW